MMGLSRRFLPPNDDGLLLRPSSLLLCLKGLMVNLCVLANLHFVPKGQVPLSTQFRQIVLDEDEDFDDEDVEEEEEAATAVVVADDDDVELFLVPRREKTLGRGRPPP
jgi:hypothetical protein